MRLQSRLNPNWKNGQEPAHANLAGLRRVVFSPPSEVLNFEPPVVSGNVSDRVSRLERTTRPASEDLTVFFGTPSRALIAILESLAFEYETGERLGLGAAVQRGKLPDFLNPKYYLHTQNCEWRRALLDADESMAPLRIAPHQKKNEDLKKCWLIVLEILFWSLERQNIKQDLQVLCTWGSERHVSSIDRIEFRESAPLAISIVKEAGTAGAVRFRVWQEYPEQGEPHTLRLRDADLLSDLEGYFLTSAFNPMSDTPPEPAEYQALVGEATSHWQPAFSTLETESQNIPRILEHLAQVLGEERIFFVNRTVIQGPAFQPRLRARESEGSLQIAVSFSIKSLGLNCLNFPATTYPALIPLTGGIETFLRLDRRESASSKKEHRSHDLLLLRHQGAALFCLLELSNWICGETLTTGERVEFFDDPTSVEFDRSYDRMVSYLQDAMPALLGKGRTPFEKMFSPQMQGHFLEFIDRLFQSMLHDRWFASHASGLAEIRETYRQILPIIRFLILHFNEASEGRLLTRTEAPLGERFRSAIEAWTRPFVFPDGHALERVPPLWVDLGHFTRHSVSLLFELAARGFEIELDGAPLDTENLPFEFRFTVKESEIDDDSSWFDLHPQVFFEGRPVSAAEVRLNFGQGDVGFVEYQGRLYRINRTLLPSLQALKSFWDRLKIQPEITEQDPNRAEIRRLPKSQALELLMLRAQGFPVQAEGRWTAMFDFFDHGLGAQTVGLPETLKPRLLPHQASGVQWLHDLYELGLGALLADEMGLGKTLQVLTFLESLRERDQLGRCLVVVPTSLVYNWKEEQERFAPSLPLFIYRSEEKGRLSHRLESGEPLVVVATYGQITENASFFSRTDWNVLVFDEAQYLKNILSRRTQVMRDLNARFKVGLTGTPMENDYLEFYSLCDLVVPGALGDVDTFRKRYVNHSARAESLERLRLTTKPLILRRTREQVRLSLPEKTTTDIRLPFTGEQKDIYKNMAMTYSRQVDEMIEAQGERQTQFTMLSALMRLRQICSDPSAVPGIVFEERPAKVEYLLGCLQDHLENQESVIVFTQFLSTLGRLQSELQRLSIPVYTLHGGLSTKERMKSVSDFQLSQEPGVLLMTLKTGGVGLNLTKASVVYHLEPWWNPAVEAQATARAHRMGQSKDVKVFNLLLEGSLEERISDLKLKKQAAFDRLFGTEESVEDVSASTFGVLSREDFEFLLKVESSPTSARQP